MPSVLELLELEAAHEENKKQLAQLALDINLYQLSQGNGNLNGLIVDSFVNLSGSDIFDPQFKASILPAIQGISMPFISLKYSVLFSYSPSFKNRSLRFFSLPDI